MTERLINKLFKTYNLNIKRDCFGRREATSREIEEAIRPASFEELEEEFEPTQEDIKEKDEK